MTITGTSFTGATSVKFNGVASPSVTAISSTSVTATVPVGATTGPISVTTPVGSGSSNSNFTVTAFGITSVTFSNIGENMQITVTGLGFGPAPVVMPFSGDIAQFYFLDNNVPFNAGESGDWITLNYQSWSDTQIQIAGFGGSYPSAGSVTAGDSVSVGLVSSTHGTLTWSGILAASP